MRIVDRSHPVKTELSVIAAEYLDAYRLRVKFSDGVNRVVDLHEFLENARNPSLRQFRKKSLFQKFRVINGNLVWQDYEMVFPVADLYRGRIS